MTFGELPIGNPFNTKPDRYIKVELMWVIEGDTRRKVNAISIFHNAGKGTFFEDSADVLDMADMTQTSVYWGVAR